MDTPSFEHLLVTCDGRRATLTLNRPEAMNALSFELRKSLADTFVSLMQRDKKVLNDQLRLVLLKPLGRAVISADVPMDLLRATLASAA